MKQKYALYPIIVSFCALFCFIVVVLFMSTSVQPLWGRTMLLLLPAVILGAIGVIACKGKLNKSKTILLTTILSIVLLLTSIFYFFLLSIWTATTDTTDIRYYTKAYDKIDDEDGVENIFPKTIPADAKNIEFLYTPQFLQGGEIFELTYTTTDERLTEWIALLEREATWIGSNKMWHQENNWSFNGSDSVRYQLDWDGGFNHGEICYVLIDTDVTQITFYYSEW